MREYLADERCVAGKIKGKRFGGCCWKCCFSTKKLITKKYVIF